jgi:hypothetical protein
LDVELEDRSAENIWVLIWGKRIREAADEAFGICRVYVEVKAAARGAEREAAVTNAKRMIWIRDLGTRLGYKTWVQDLGARFGSKT